MMFQLLIKVTTVYSGSLLRDLIEAEEWLVKSTIKQSIGQAVAKQRKAVGLTQAQLAERLNLSLDAISRLERGNIGLTVERMVELAEIP